MAVMTDGGGGFAKKGGLRADWLSIFFKIEEIRLLPAWESV